MANASQDGAGPLRIALVVQRYGLEVSGGSELMARWLAEHLVSMGIGQVDVLTTCALRYQTWANHYPAGTSEINGVVVHRYPVDHERVDVEAENGPYRSAVDLLQNGHTPDEPFGYMWGVGPASTALLKKIEGSYADYDIFIFFTYEYATTIFGLPLVADKAILVPTTHDFYFLKFTLFRWLFHLPRGIAFLTHAEKELVHDRFKNEYIPYDVVGVGLTPPAGEPSPARFREKFGVENRFLCYVGRMAEEKGVLELINFFVALKDSSRTDLDLVLIGKGDVEIPERPDIIATGFVSEQEKFDALAAAELVVVPSKFESLSIIALEAWLMGRPIIVNGACEVLVQQSRFSQAGLYYDSEEEFAHILNQLETDQAIAKSLGANGRRFVEANYRWETVMAKFSSLFELAQRRTP